MGRSTGTIAIGFASDTVEEGFVSILGAELGFDSAATCLSSGVLKESFNRPNSAVRDGSM
jgi:hypothetical protein